MNLEAQRESTMLSHSFLLSTSFIFSTSFGSEKPRSINKAFIKPLYDLYDLSE